MSKPDSRNMSSTSFSMANVARTVSQRGSDAYLQFLTLAETAHITLVVFRIVVLALDLYDIAVILGGRSQVDIGVVLRRVVIHVMGRHLFS